MKAVAITKTGGPEALQVREYPDPQPGSRELSVKVTAAGVNFADILARKGLYPDGPPLPAVVGYEVAGEVLECGKEVRRFRAGDKVLALTRFQGYSEMVVVPEDQVFHIPENLSSSQAAAIPVNYLTAWQLVEMGGLKKDETLVIHNAGGGVGLAALEIARKRGARTIGTASAWKHERLLERGLDVAIDYRTEDWVDQVQHHTDGKGADLIFDPLGGSNWKKSFLALRPAGRLGLFGVSEMTRSGLYGPLKFFSVLQRMPFYTPIRLMNTNKGVYGVNLGRMWTEKKKVGQWAKAILNVAKRGWIHPYIDAAFTFEQAPEAHRYLEERKNFGKVLLVPGGIESDLK